MVEQPVLPLRQHPVLYVAGRDRRMVRAARRPHGAILEIGEGLKLAERWFGDYASPQWRRKTSAEGEAIFREVGLDSTFWRMPGSFK